MRVAVDCPFCKRSMATSAAFAGQTIACPNCRGEFAWNPPAKVPAVNASDELRRSDMSPPRSAAAKNLEAGTATVTVPPPPANEPITGQVAAPPRKLDLSPPANPGRPPSQPPLPAPANAANPSGTKNTARLKTAATAPATILPATDGKLPGLLLADSPATDVNREGRDRPIPMWLACLAIVGSTLLSLLLLVNDVPIQQSLSSRQTDARTAIAQFYGNDLAPLKPFQVLLREAQQAHSRGDRSLERQRYRQVLGLLRSERRSKYETITGVPSEDEQLANYLSVLLSNE